jgi:hypothetical protein
VCGYILPNNGVVLYKKRRPFVIRTDLEVNSILHIHVQKNENTRVSEHPKIQKIVENSKFKEYYGIFEKMRKRDIFGPKREKTIKTLFWYLLNIQFQWENAGDQKKPFTNTLFLDEKHFFGKKTRQISERKNAFYRNRQKW